MIEHSAVALVVVVQFTASNTGATGLTVTCTVRKWDGTSWTTLVSSQSAIEVGDGGYSYQLAAGYNTGEGMYLFAFTTTGTADLKKVLGGWVVNKAGVENLDASMLSVKTKTDQLVFTNAGKVDAAVLAAGDFAQAAADKVWSAAARTLTAFSFAVDVSAAAVSLIWDKATSALTTVGSIGKHLVDQLAAIVSGVTSSTDPLTNQVPGSYAGGTAGAALGRIGTGEITAVSPLSPDGRTMDVTRGDDYNALDVRSFDWIDVENMWGDPVTAAVFTARAGGVLALTKACTIVVATGINKKVRLELTSAETTLFRVGSPAYRFDVQLTAGGRTTTPIKGVVNVIEDQTHA